MQDTNSAGSVSSWCADAMVIAEQEITRMYKLGYVPFSLDRSDLTSDLNQLIAEMVAVLPLPDGALVRISMRRNLMNLIRDEYLRQRKEWPVEIRTGESLLEGIAFDQFLLQLSREQQDVIYLLYVDGQTERAAAALLGITQPALQRRENAALKKLRIFLSPRVKIPCSRDNRCEDGKHPTAS